jgi:SpoVK/Ycf46/Vps4 family AAA+-type ATPase
VPQALTRKFLLHPGVDLRSLAAACPVQLTGADLYALCADAWMHGLRRHLPPAPAPAPASALGLLTPPTPAVPAEAGAGGPTSPEDAAWPAPFDALPATTCPPPGTCIRLGPPSSPSLRGLGSRPPVKPGLGARPPAPPPAASRRARDAAANGASPPGQRRPAVGPRSSMSGRAGGGADGAGGGAVSAAAAGASSPPAPPPPGSVAPGAGGGVAVTVEASDFEAALDALVPSLSAAELAKYERMREQYEGGGARRRG